MKQYEIRTKDLKTVVHVFGPEYDSERARSYWRINWCDPSIQCPSVLVEHTLETDAEADKARLDWLNTQCADEYQSADRPSHWVRHWEIRDKNDVRPSLVGLRKAIDAARQSPQPTVRIIATPEGPR